MKSIISKDLQKAKSILEDEELVAIPTETVYGLAGNIYSEKAIKSIFATKKRPFFNPLIVHIPNAGYLKNVVSEIPEQAQLLAKTFWPGPLTLVLKKDLSIPDLITAGKDTVAVRVPSHPLTLELLKSLDFPLAAPSANPFGSISPTKAEHVENYFSSQIKMVLDGGECQRGIESTIVGFNKGNPVAYRLGSISLEDIESITGPLELLTNKEELPDAPGMLERHYAPKTETIVSTDFESDLTVHSDKKIGLLLYLDSGKKHPVEEIIYLSNDGNLNTAAKNLYASLHYLDTLELDLIIIEKLPDIELGRSINDRINRATK